MLGYYCNEEIYTRELRHDLSEDGGLWSPNNSDRSLFAPIVRPTLQFPQFLQQAMDDASAKFFLLPSPSLRPRRLERSTRLLATSGGESYRLDAADGASVFGGKWFCSD